ncbi:hypothetical protein VKI21_00375 [Cyanobacterium aponinum UTEX 3222]|uniref:hypothetical protein n=1 Tax=Cyanobacterium aponinum TaxID=379064 RepID=UPI003084BF20|nr:hypothetical protein VKI21_00375 [Cyanobacterium aponinum UTEX 3222]
MIKHKHKCDRYQDKIISFTYLGRDKIHINAKNSFAGLIEEIKNNSLWKNLKAVKFDQAYYVNFMTWGLSHILGTDGVIDYLFKYPGNFPS